MCHARIGRMQRSHFKIGSCADPGSLEFCKRILCVQSSQVFGIFIFKISKLCNLAVTMLKAMPPRVYVSESFKDPFLIFTDGAWEDGKATGGALTFDPRTGESRVFEVEIPAALVAKWLEEVGEQLISQIEFFILPSASAAVRLCSTDLALLGSTTKLCGNQRIV